MGMIDKILLLYLCIAIACAFWQPEIVFGDANSALTGVFNVEYNKTTGEPMIPTCAASQGGDNSKNCLNSGFLTRLPTSEDPDQSTFIDKMFSQLASGANFFIDALNNVIALIKILWNILFSPWVIFTSPEMTQFMPSSAPFYIIALPLVFLGLIAFINWIRSGIT